MLGTSLGLMSEQAAAGLAIGDIVLHPVEASQGRAGLSIRKPVRETCEGFGIIM